ncbi:hypothetical protein L0657_22670 [Dyadobacter sp. CY345]|uniref:hypothetical protein n=1 Tax=Dyadobacter sp. CY345 TaxID=2909335 RepID=UPI001F40E178|nr:hypothetical protein [Dyadobacter sp. CY345]MCF2446778.1 hypothetical protein [Dyadobacter sp. CY345]
MNFKMWVVILLLTGSADRNSYAQVLKNLAPDYVGLQYAGSIGFISVGGGYDLFRQRVRAGLNYGYVPKEMGGNLHLLSTSLFYIPLKLKVSNTVTINPLDVGMKAVYHFGDQFYLNWPERFPRGYYWWKSALRLHLATESSVTHELKSTGRIKSVTGYIELNTNDLYLISYVLNPSSLSVTDIIKIGCGLRIHF